MKKTVAVLCAALFSLTASCGNDDEDQAKDNIKTALLEEDAGLAASADITEEQAECVSNGMVDELGVEKLQDYGLLNNDLEVQEDPQAADMDRGDAESMARVFVGCVDVEKIFQEQFAENGAGLSKKQQDCIRKAVDVEVIEKVLADTFQGEDADPTAQLQDELMACIAGG